MTNNDKSKIEAILKVIAKDEELIESFSNMIGEDPDEFGDWIDQIKL